MHNGKIIVFSFIILTLLAISTLIIWQGTRDHHINSQIVEQEVQKHVKKYFSVCPHPPLGEIQPFIDCHNKMARRDL